MISVIENDILCPQYVSKAMAPRNPKLVKEPEEDTQLIPSVYLKNISMTTEERLNNTHTMRIPEKLQLLEMGDIVHHKISTVNINEPIFQPFPSEIFFQQYEPFNVYEVPLLLENKDRIPRTIKVNQEASPYFKLIPPPDAHLKVAPGLALVFKVQFTPEENKDYEHEIVCTTERERYVVPIKAIGARAIVDIQDEIHFPTCPVLMASTKTILLRNIGNRDAKFSFFTLLPFSVSPVHGTIAENANSQVDIEFYPTEVGNHQGQLYLRYDTGEVLFITLHAVAQDINIRLDRNSVRIENTFISLTNQRSVFIHNRTNVVAKYKWTNFPTWNEEIHQKQRFISDIEQTRQAEIENFIRDYIRDPSLHDKISVMNRSYLNRRKLIEEGSGLFYDEVFKIEPIEGEIWPNQTMQINIMFKPLEAKSYIKMAYCEITGRENRLPLQLRGEGKGPKVQLSVNVMNVGPIFIGSCHYYEVILANHGQIHASYVIQKSVSTFASFFTFKPNNGTVQPGGHQAIRVKFQGSSLGDFDEVFRFQVEGRPQPVELKFRGSVIGPTFHFDVAQLEFGNVSYGFQYTKTFQMHNTSLIPMNFRLHVPGDGLVDSIPSIKGNFYPKRTDKQTIPPKEFKIIPSEGVVEAMSSLQMIVQFVSNTVSRYEMALVVDVINVADQVFSMPITGRCLVPTVVVANPVLMYHRCFLNYPYTQYVKLQNLSNLRARYDLEPQDSDKRSSISYCSSEPSGIIEPFSSFDVPLTIKTGCLRDLVAPAYFKVFGSSEYITVEISCYGEGPVVHVTPLEVDWGTISVLKDVERRITLLNESPIPATFEASMSRPNSFFHVSPKEGVILPEEKMILTLNANINDIINFEDKINIKFGDNSERFVILKAFGEGSTIVADPPLSSVLNLGPHFSNKTLKKRIVFTNKGRRQQQVNWVIQTNTLHLPKLSKQETQLSKLSDKQISAKTSTSPETKASVFEIIPHRFKLLPGESMGVYLKGFVEKPADINEILHCYSILGKHGGKKLVINVNVKAQFIDPLLDFSRESIFFRTDKTPDMKLDLLYQDLQLTNTAILPLTINLQIPDPFKIVYNDEILSEVKMQIDVGEVYSLKIQFNPCYKEDLFTRVIEQNLTISYDEHPHIDYITLHGEVYFPNLTFEQTEVDFGCIMNNSSETKIINIMNKSPLVVRYQWTMFTLELTKKVVNHDMIKNPDSTASNNGTESKSKMSTVAMEDLEIYKDFDSELFTSVDISSTIMNVGIPDLYGGAACTILNELDEENSGKDNCQAFNLLPMNGVLHPGQAELVKVTFFGHANTAARVTAMCTVEGGPTYCIQLSGEASYLSYKFDVLSIDYGEQKYDQVAEATITLTNTGLVGCDFSAINILKMEDEIPPQTPIVVPGSGHIKSGDSQVLTVKYLPGFPVKFNSSFSIQVNHFKPETITLVGNGIFPHLLLNLPRRKGDSLYKRSLKAAKAHLSKEAASGNAPMESKTEKENDEVDNVEEKEEETFKETELQKEVDRVAVTFCINGLESESICRSDLELPSFVLDQKGSSSIIYSNTRILRKDSSKIWKQRPYVPLYELDLGFVILGLITSRTVSLTNCGNIPVSFKITYEHLQYWGFKIDLHKVTNLPPQENASFQLTFDPRGANLTKGPIETKLLINITNGPQIIVSLRAHITMPDMEVSHDILDFENVKCGECKIMSTQLHNHQYVQCEWSYLPSSARKLLAKNETQDTANKKAALRPRKNFEIIPPSGVLQPGQRVNIQVKFMPTEGKLYEKRIPIRIAQSSERIILQCKGNGIEPVLQLMEEHITYRPILPHSCGDEKEVIVKNPCDFPIEFYSVDFDSNYLEEEKILRLMRSYDDYKTLLLPPRAAGEKLPQELLDFYRARKKRLEEMEKSHKEGMSVLSSVSEDTQEQEVKEEAETDGVEAKKYDSLENLIEVIIPPFNSKCTSPENMAFESVDPGEKLNVEDIDEVKARDADSSGVGELEMTPVAAAITRYLGIDLSPDGQAARNRRGIAIIIHGSPFSGKSTTAADIAHYYDAALLNIDDVVTDAISKGATPASLKARELCGEAAQRKREEQRALEESEEKKASSGLETNNTSGGAYPRKVSNMGKGLAGMNAVGNRGAEASQMQSCSPPPLVYPPVKELNLKSGISGESGLVSCILPEDILVEILAERLQMPDCHKGVVIDGIESMFSPSFLSLEQVILRAFNNRRYIFHISLRLDFGTYQNRKKELKAREEKQKILEDELERKWIEEMSEGEYDAMSEEQRARVEDRLMVIKKNRMRREIKEKEERERKEREMQEAENRRLMEIKSKKKGKRPAPPSNEKDKDKKAGAPGKGATLGEKGGTKGFGHKYEGDSKGGLTERPDSQATDRNDMPDERRKKSVRKTGGDASSNKGKEEIPEDPYKELTKEELLEMQKFQLFDNTYKDIIEILEFWDRVSLQAKYPLSPSEKSEVEDVGGHSAKKNVRVKDKFRDSEKEKEKFHPSVTHLEKKCSAIYISIDEPEVNKEKVDPSLGVPHILIECTETETSYLNQILNSSKLPVVTEVLDGLGLGPKGPPIPPPSTFAVVQYPVKRKPPAGADILKQYIFVASSPSDPNIGFEEKSKESDFEEVQVIEKEKGERTTQTSRSKTKADKTKLSSDSAKRRSAEKKKSSHRLSQFAIPSPLFGVSSPGSDDIFSPGTPHLESKKLNYFRWIVPANGYTTLRVRFLSEELGEFNQTLTFEILGTKKRYQIFNHGLCVFPSICQDPKVVFKRHRKKREPDEIVHKRYVMSSETFEFGPLLVGRYADSLHPINKYKEFPENLEILTIMNTSPIEADISFCFLKDTKAETFSLDPPTMILPPQRSKHLAVWAFPRSVKLIEDAIVCCVKENPEPILFKISCEAFRPDLDLDRRVFQFDKVLILREEKRTIRMRNRTKLPVGWKLTGIENLGEEFTVSSTGGVVPPLGETPLYAYFQARKPLVMAKKQIRLEIFDIDNTVKSSSEIISILGEAYDVAVDINFPKAMSTDEDRCLDFGTVRVSEDAKQTITIKNKGKYDILFEIVPNTDPIICKAYAALFSISPVKGILGPLDRPLSCQLLFRTHTEISIKDQIIFRCLVIDPAGDILVATLPIRISVRAVYSKFVIAPDCDIDFGALLVNLKRTRTITIENKGEFEFKYAITKNVADKDSTVSKAKKSIEPVQARCSLGIFNIYPATGNILSGAQTTVIVECSSENLGLFVEELCVDISEHDPKKLPHGIVYLLKAEICAPSICVDDIAKIFEEHRICKSLSHWRHYNKIDSGGVYGESEKKFMFSNVIVGKKAKARFKIINTSKVPCDANIIVKSSQSRGSGKHQQLEVFDVEPSKAQILNHSHFFVTITFSPLTMQMYTTTFEVSVESPMNIKPESLIFEIAGEGVLPRAVVSQPSNRNQNGQPLLLFKQNFVGDSETLKIVITNEASLPCKVDLDLIDTEDVFSLKPVVNKLKVDEFTQQTEQSVKKQLHTASVSLDCNQKAEFDVTFQPKEAVKSQAYVHLVVHDNPYESTSILLVGEGYFEEITFDDIYLDPMLELKYQHEVLGKNQIRKANTMLFGDCHIGKAKTQSLTITNRCQQETICFQWLTKEPLTFSPQMGHLRPGQSKNVVLTFKSYKPIVLQEEVIPCAVKKITFEKPLSQVPDWDDRIHVIKWVEVESTPLSNAPDMVAVKETPNAMFRKRRKVVEIEPEPANTVIPGTEREIGLFINGTAEYCKYECHTTSIYFKDTYMFQTRSFQFCLTNKEIVQLEYSWQVVLDEVQLSSNLPEEEVNPSPSVQTDTYIPITIEPDYGTIAAETSCTFTVKYSPLKAAEVSGKLVCCIPNLEEEVEAPTIIIKAKGLMPYCHFDVKESDYIRNARRDPKQSGPAGAPPSAVLDPNIRAIELECVGLQSKISKTFPIFNPTDERYTYEWICQDEKPPKSNAGFSCLTSRGSVKPGKKAEMVFEFMPYEIGYSESFWEFQIAQKNIKIPFLFVANVHDPDILFDRSHVLLKRLVVDHSITEIVHLVNNEECEFEFAFTEDSIFSAGVPSKLRIEPMSGTVAPKSRFPISIHFLPLVSKIVSFNASCVVTGKATPLQLNIKGGGYSVNCAVFCADSEGIVMELTKTGDNEIDFGSVEINEKSTRTVVISNSCKINFEYKWVLNEKASQLLKITPLSGFVKTGFKNESRIDFCPNKKLSLTGCKVYLKISNGPTYNIFITGDAGFPNLEFSFLTYNFGNTFIHKAGMEQKIAVLQVRNNDKKDISLDCLYTPTKQLMYEFKATKIEPKKSVTISFSFYPRKPMKYTESVPFLINGLSTQNVTFIGRGIEMQVEVADNRKIVRLDSHEVGSVIKRIVPIVNRTPASVTFSIVCTPNCTQLKESGVLTIFPASSITLAAMSGSTKIQIVFNPKSRIPQFSEEVCLEQAGVHQPLFLIRGFCLAMELNLETNSIPFGAIVLQSSSTRKVSITNTGDINVKIRWDIDRLSPDFTISPVQCHMIVGKQVIFEVIFKPLKIQRDIRYKNIPCYVNEGEYPPLLLTLTGTCTGTPTVRDICNFQTHVRQKETKNLIISNKTNQLWELRPIIDGIYWQGPLKFVVEPQVSKAYEITYKPMRMTGPESKKHTGSILFPLPDGTGIFYNLFGIADPPKPIDKIIRDIPYKTKYTELLPVYNWSKQTISFNVKREVYKADKLDPTTTITGLDYIDVPAGCHKNYKLDFHAYKEGVSCIKVIFTHLETGEYQFYELTLRSIKSGSMGNIELVTPVRSSIRHTVKIENPLTVPAHFNFNTNVSELIIPASAVYIPEQSEGEVTIEYQPIKIGEVTGKLELFSSELGNYLYELNLKATAAGYEKSIYMQTSLGQIITQVAKFINYTKQKTDYLCKVDNPDFHVDKSIPAASASSSGTEISFEIFFEPSHLGEQRATLTASSLVGGEYVFPLFGTCVPPKPQGPFTIKSGSNIFITFRNIFNTATSFKFQVDDERFILSKRKEMIRPHKDYRISVGFECNNLPVQAEVKSKLIVSCPHVTADIANLQWLFYLKGISV